MQGMDMNAMSAHIMSEDGLARYYVLPRIFDRKDGPIRVFYPQNNPHDLWFVTKDICDILELANPSQAIKDAKVTNSERGIMNINSLRNAESIITPGNPNVGVISLIGVFKLASNSNKQKAKDFRDWLFGTVLMEINIVGTYMEPDIKDRLRMDSNYINTIIAKLDALEGENQRLQNDLSIEREMADKYRAAITQNITYSIAELASYLNKFGFGFNERDLFNTLREDGYLYKNRRENIPTKKSLDNNLFVSETRQADNGKMYSTPRATLDAIDHFHKKYRGSRLKPMYRDAVGPYVEPCNREPEYHEVPVNQQNQ